MRSLIELTVGVALVGAIGCGRSGLDGATPTDAGASTAGLPDLAAPADLTPPREDLASAAPPDPDYCRGQGGEVLWAQTFAGEAPDGYVSHPSLVASPTGDVFLSGDIEGAITLGGPLIHSDPYVMISFLGKFDSEGRYRWSSGSLYLGALDGSGNVWLGPTFFLDRTFDPTYQTELVEIAGSDGKLSSVREYGPAWPSYNTASLFAVNPAGDLIAVSRLAARTTSYLGQPVSVGNDGALCLARLTRAGDIVWLRTFDASLLDTTHPYLAATSLSIDGGGNIWLTLGIDAPGGIGGPPLKGTYLVKYDDKGAFVLQQPIAGASPLVAATTSGNAVVAGSVYAPETAELRMVVRKLDANGVERWARSFVLNGLVGPLGLAVDGKENVAWMGQTAGEVDFGGGPLPFPAGQGALTLLKLDRNGSHVWSKRARAQYADGGTGWSDSGPIPQGISFDAAGNLYATFAVGDAQELCGATLSASAPQRGSIALVKLAP